MVRLLVIAGAALIAYLLITRSSTPPPAAPAWRATPPPPTMTPPPPRTVASTITGLSTAGCHVSAAVARLPLGALCQYTPINLAINYGPAAAKATAAGIVTAGNAVATGAKDVYKAGKSIVNDIGSGLSSLNPF